MMPQPSSSPQQCHDAEDRNRQQLLGFTENGHALLRQMLPRAGVEALRPVFQAYIAQMHKSLNAYEKSIGASATRATFNLLEAPQEIRDFICSPRLGEIAAQALDAPRVRMLHFNGFFKPGGGMATPWHQDMTYIPLDCADTVTLWVPLVPVSQSMGSLAFATGSHRHGLEGLVNAQTKFPIAVNMPMEPGDISLHHGWTAHRSHPNQSQYTREAIAISYYPDGARVRVAAGAPAMVRSILEDCLPGLSPGDPAQGPATPIVFDRTKPYSQTGKV